MVKRKLKSYKKYLAKLLDYAKSNNITVVKRDENDNGQWMPSVRRIALDINFSESEEIATLLHELGHSIDDLMHIEAKEFNYIERAYKAFYADKANRHQCQEVIKHEEIAWKNGRIIAKRLKITLGQWYTDNEKVSLKTYKEAYK